MREKLIELLGHLEYQYCESHSIMRENVVDYLISKGVTIPVRCKDCKHFDPKKALRPGGIWCGYWGTDPDPEDWCCKGERGTNDE